MKKLQKNLHSMEQTVETMRDAIVAIPCECFPCPCGTNITVYAAIGGSQYQNANFIMPE